MVKTINLKKTTKSELIELVRKLKRRKNDQYFLQENGKAMAVLISQAEYEKYREEQRLKAVERLQKLMLEVHAQIPQDIPEDEVEKDIIEAIHEMRGVKC
jgi:PHD/YefM family antitoxin component YafN of YafNO toxin-antitoxin module